jgi:hypothetical protein
MLALLLLACGPDDLEGVDHAESYLGPSPRRWQFVPQDDPAGTPLQIESRDGQWELRSGARWRDAAPLARWEVTAAPDLVVDGALLLPELVKPGATGEGVQVTDLGERAVYYGTFPRVVTVKVASGVFAGEQAFARDYGPVLLSWDPARSGLTAAVWELASYEDVD